MRLALDRWQHFQFALKRHPFETDMEIAVDADGRNALYEELPLGPDGPGNGKWGLSRYHLPRASQVAVWNQTGHVLPALSDLDPPKGMAEVVMIPVVAAIGNAISHATGRRFYRTPITPARIKEALPT